MPAASVSFLVRALLIVAFLIPVTASLASEKGASTGLPLPRFVSLKSGEANMRSGPGTAYPIRWVYRRKHLPVVIHDEHGHWRAIRDPWGESSDAGVPPRRGGRRRRKFFPARG